MATIVKQFLIPLSEQKMEFIHVSSLTDADTITSLMANPAFAVALPADKTASFSTNAINVAVSGKTLTLNNSDCDGDEVALILVFGT